MPLTNEVALDDGRQVCVEKVTELWEVMVPPCEPDQGARYGLGAIDGRRHMIRGRVQRAAEVQSLWPRT